MAEEPVRILEISEDRLTAEQKKGSLTGTLWVTNPSCRFYVGTN